MVKGQVHLNLLPRSQLWDSQAWKSQNRKDCLILYDFLRETSERAKQAPAVEPAVFIHEVVQKLVDGGDLGIVGGMQHLAGLGGSSVPYSLSLSPSSPWSLSLVVKQLEICDLLLRNWLRPPAEDTFLPKRSSNDTVVLVRDVALDVLACARGRASRELQSHHALGEQVLEIGGVDRRLR